MKIRDRQNTLNINKLLSINKDGLALLYNQNCRRRYDNIISVSSVPVTIATTYPICLIYEKKVGSVARLLLRLVYFIILPQLQPRTAYVHYTWQTLIK